MQYMTVYAGVNALCSIPLVTLSTLPGANDIYDRQIGELGALRFHVRVTAANDMGWGQHKEAVITGVSSILSFYEEKSHI